MSIAANKVNGIRCIRAVNSDDAFKGKHHNGANVLALGANLDFEITKEIVDAFISTKPANLDRYIRRIDKIIDSELEGLIIDKILNNETLSINKLQTFKTAV